MNAVLKYNAGYYKIDSSLPGFHAGITGREINHINYDASHLEIRSDEKRILSSITGVENRKIIMLDQVHGNMLIHVVNEPSTDLPAYGEADGLITPIKGIMLVIRTADCVPVFIYDPNKEVLGAVHAGWKGTMLNIPGKCVRDMAYLYGSDPADIRAFILPSIGPDSYEVNEDVACHFPENRLTKNGKIHVDLWGAAERLLKLEGIREDNIYNSRICNRINHSDYFSHRYGDKGRNLNFAFMR